MGARASSPRTAEGRPKSTRARMPALPEARARAVPGRAGAPSVLSALPAVFVIAGLATVPQALLLRRLRFRELAAADLLSQALGYGLVAIAMALLGFGIRAGSHWGLAGAARPVTTRR